MLDSLKGPRFMVCETEFKVIYVEYKIHKDAGTSGPCGPLLDFILNCKIVTVKSFHLFKL